jgi:hypothetical protein
MAEAAAAEEPPAAAAAGSAGGNARAAWMASGADEAGSSSEAGSAAATDADASEVSHSDLGGAPGGGSDSDDAEAAAEPPAAARDESWCIQATGAPTGSAAEPSGALSEGLPGKSAAPRTSDDDASDTSDDNLCSICFERAIGIAFSGCGHRMCVACAFQMCGKVRSAPLCPFCREPLGSFESVVLRDC